MVRGFVAYDLAVSLYHRCEGISAKHYLRDQLVRASLSIALGSARETQALLEVLKQSVLLSEADRLGGVLYRLVYPKSS